MENELEIRIAEPSDAAALLAIYKPYVENITITFEYDVPTLEDFTARIAHTLERYPYLVALLDGEPVAYAYAGVFKSRAAYDRAVEMSIYVKNGVHGYGIGRALYAALETILRLQHVTNLNACITYPSAGSDQFHGKLGYTTVAHFHKCGYKFGKWMDMIWMEKFLSSHTDNPAPFLPFSELRRISPTIETILLDR